MIALASGVAHELSTPLGVVTGRAEQLLERARGDERSQRFAQAIIDQVDRMRGVIRGLLQLARGDVPTLATLEPARVLEAACGLVRHRFEDAGVRLVERSQQG